MDKLEIVRFVDNELELDVRADKENDTVWLTQEQIAKLFGKARSTITEHINNIFNDKELDENTSVGFSDESVSHRPSKYYNLDVILSVGYRVNSKRGIASSTPIIVKRGRSLCAIAAIPSTSLSFSACCIRSIFLPVSSIKV